MSKNSFKAKIRERYKGRGNCWIKVASSTDVYNNIIEKLKSFNAEEYLSDISDAGFAWIRFISPSGTEDDPYITCEIRYRGSKEEQNDCTIDISDSVAVDMELLGNTPFKLDLEKSHIKPKKVKKIVKKYKKEKKEKFVNEAQKFQESLEEQIESEIITIKESILTKPSTTDILQWRSFLKSEGLLKNGY